MLNSILDIAKSRTANNFSKTVGHNVRKKKNSVRHLRKPVGHKLL